MTGLRHRRRTALTGRTALACLLLGCGSGQYRGAGLTFFQTADGLRVTGDRWPAGDAIALTLWIDAGSRDASPAQLAVLAAWSVRPAGASVQVFPDGTAISIACGRHALDDCLRRVRATLCGTPDQAAVHALLPSLLAQLDSLRGHSSGEAPAAERAALNALLGDAHEAFLPFGQPENDGTVTAAAVMRFVRDHYGPERALVETRGAVTADTLQHAVSETLSHCRSARRARAERLLVPHSGVALAPGVEDGTTVAVATETLAEGKALGEMLAERFGQVRRVSAFPVRGGAILLASTRLESGSSVPVDDDTLEALIRQAAFAQPRAITRDVDLLTPGQQFITDGPRRIPVAPRPVALAISGHRSAREPNPVGPNRDADGSAARAMHTRALEAPRGRFEETESELRWTSNNGAMLLVEAAASGTARVGLRFSPGSEDEPAESHGQLALVAELIADRCSAILGTAFQPFVTPTRWGLIGEAAPGTSATLLQDLLYCVRSMRVDPETLMRVKASLLERLSTRELTRLVVATTLTPERPGTIAPLGKPEVILRTSPSEVRHGLVEAQTRFKLVAHVIGPDPSPADAPNDWTGTLAELQAWPRSTSSAGERFSAPALSSGPRAPTTFEAPADWPATALLTFWPEALVDEGPAVEAGMVSFAAAMLAALHRNAPVAAELVAGGQLRGRPFVTIRATAPPPAHDQILHHVDEALRHLPRPGGDELQHLVWNLRVAAADPERRLQTGLQGAIEENGVGGNDVERALHVFDVFRTAAARVAVTAPRPTAP